MPSPRSRDFIIDASYSERALPPASEGLRAPSDVSETAIAKRRRQHPAKMGRPPEDDESMTETVMTVYESLRQGATARELATELECSEGRARKLMLSAKEKFASRVDDYLDAHLVATKVAATQGNAKPSEWALENLSADGVRVVDPPTKNLPPPAPTFNVGFVIGGMATPVKQLPPGK